MYCVTTEHMRQLEQATVEAGNTWAGLMEQAGWGVAQEALPVLRGARGKRVLVLVGPGNNGGDGLVAARHLHDAGARVELALWRRADAAQDTNWQLCRARDLTEYAAAEPADQPALQTALAQADLVIDALLGMGVNRAVAGSLADLLRLVAAERARRRAETQQPFRVLAVDVPTGIHSDSGAVLAVALRADVTVATGLTKRGLLLYPGRSYAGALRLAEIGIPQRMVEARMTKTIERTDVHALLPARPEDAHKGTFGKVLVVAGSLLYPGAAALATAGAGRVGAGLVTLAAGRGVIALSGRGAEVTVQPLPEAQTGALGEAAAKELLDHLDAYTVLLVGPGLGQDDSTLAFLKLLLGLRDHRSKPPVGFRITEASTLPDPPPHSVTLPPTVLDADALNLLAKIDDWPTHLPRNRFVLTPHPGEMKRLLQTDALTPDVAAAAIEAAQQWEQVVVLKGATTVIAAPDGRNFVHAAGNPALATAGTGDVLAGAIAGLLAQGVALFDAAVLAVYLHSAAGHMVRTELGDAGALAGDLLPRLPQAIRELRAAL